MKNKYVVNGDEIIIFLNRRNGPKLSTLISIEDFNKVDSFPGTWHAYWSPRKKSFYVQGNVKTNFKWTQISLHRLIMDAPDGLVVDHKDGKNTLNNCRYNLRIATSSENSQNRVGANCNNRSSGIRGVTWQKDMNKWRARIHIKGKAIFLGLFTDIYEAESVVKAARSELMPFSKEAYNH